MSELPIKTTLKAGTGYDAPWVTVDANDPNDLAFKLKGLIEHESALTLVIEAANALKAHNNGAPIEAAQATQATHAAPTEPAAQPQQAWGQNASTAPSQPAPSAPPQRGNKYGGPLHPEGKTCNVCPNVLEKKQTSGGKWVWRCPEWRWNNGNANGHLNEWIDN